MCFPFTLTKNICMDILFLILSTEWMGISTVMKKETGKNISSQLQTVFVKNMVCPPLVYDPHNKIGKSYAAHYAEKEGRPSSEKIIKADIDFVIAASEDWNDFVKQMESLGYKIRQGKYVTYIPPVLNGDGEIPVLVQDTGKKKSKRGFKTKERKRGQKVFCPLNCLRNMKEKSFNIQRHLRYFKIKKNQNFLSSRALS